MPRNLATVTFALIGLAASLSGCTRPALEIEQKTRAAPLVSPTSEPVEVPQDEPAKDPEAEYTIHELLGIDPDAAPEPPEFFLRSVPREWLTRRTDRTAFEAEFVVTSESHAEVAMRFTQELDAGGELWRFYQRSLCHMTSGFALVREGSVVAAVTAEEMYMRPMPGSERRWIIGNCVYVASDDVPPRTKVPLRPDASQQDDSSGSGELPVGCASHQ